jgi:Domain of unknown function (DUF1707)
VRTRPVNPVTVGRGRFRASDADRELVIEDLKVAFVQGRLTKDELAERAGQALTSRTYADLAAVVADIPATRPRPARAHAPAKAQAHAAAKAQAQDPAKAQAQVPARKAIRPRANARTLTWGLAVATIALPAMIAAALVTGSQNLFSATIVPIMAYVMFMLIAAANVVASRLEDDSADEPHGTG